MVLQSAPASTIQLKDQVMQKDEKTGDRNSTASTGTARNQGEGDIESAKRFNREELAFVESERGRQAIDRAGDVDPSEEQELVDAEQEGLSHRKDGRPAATRKK
jgi:hypothetical protein